MNNILKTVESTLEYKASESNTIRNFLKLCLNNEASAETHCQNANLQTVAGVACFILTCKGNKKEVNAKTKEFICNYFIKQGKEAPNNRMLQRRIQLTRFVIDNNQFLKEYTTTPTRLVEETLKVINKYKSYNNLLTLATEANKKASDKTPQSEIEKLLKRINKLFDDISDLENPKEATQLMQYMRDKADALSKGADSDSDAGAIAI